MKMQLKSLLKLTVKVPDGDHQIRWNGGINP